MKRFHIPWKYNTLAKWIIMGGIVLLVPIICSFFSFLVNKNLLEKKTNQINEFILKSVQYNIDNKMCDIVNTANYIVLDNDFSDSSLERKNGLEFQRQIDICYSKLKMYDAANSEIDIFIYFPQLDFLLTTETANDIKYIHRTLQYSNKMEHTIDEWKTYITSNLPNSFIVSDELSYENYGKESLVYITRNSQYGVADSNVICVSIPADFIVDLLENGDGYQYTILVVEDNGSIVANYGSRISLQNELINIADYEEYEFFNFVNEGEEYVASFAESAICDWKYIVCTSREEYMNEIQTNVVFSLVSIFFWLIMGWLAMTLLQQYNYRPIKRLARKLLNGEPSSGVDELNFVEQNLMRMYKENEQMRSSLENRMEREREWYLLAKIRGYKYFAQDIDLCEMAGCNDDDMEYLLVTINMDLEANDNINLADDFSLLSFSIHNVVDELFAKRCKYLKTIDDAFIVYLFLLNKAENMHGKRNVRRR